MTLTDYFRVLRRRWLVVLLCAALGAAAAVAVTVVSPKTYTATSTSFVSLASTGGDTTGASIYSGSQFTMAQVQSYSALVSSPRVLQPVISQLGLKLTVPELRAKVTATSPQNSVLLHVTATDSSAQGAARIANATGVELGKLVQEVGSPEAAGKPLVRVTQTEPAVAPATPSSPRPKLDIALGLLIGLAVGVGIAVVRSQLDTTISSADDLQAMTSVTPLGVVEAIKGAERRAIHETTSGTTHAEGFRTVRTNLQFADVDNPPGVVVVSSAAPGDGKTTTAINLAVAVAQSGSRVCVVDADLRRPKVADHFEIDGGVGLTNVLAGQFELDDVLVAWRRGLVTVLVAGSIPSDPSALLASKAMAATLHTLRQRFDMVIVDVPPLLSVTDAAVVARVTDGALLVVRHRRTTREQVRRALESLRVADARLLGTVLVGVPMKGRVTQRYGYATSNAVAITPVDHGANTTTEPLGRD